MRGWRDFLGWLKEFFACGLWQLQTTGEGRGRRALIYQLQLGTLVLRAFLAHRCPHHATALAFTTLLALVPLLALMFAVLKSFGVHHLIEPYLLTHLSAGSDTVATAIINYIGNTRVGQLGAIGLVALAISAFSLATTMEQVFNDIWGETRTRSTLLRFTGFFLGIALVPLVVGVAVSMTGSLASQTVVQWLLDRAVIGELLLLLFQVLPYLLMWLVFASLYLFVPCARVSPRAALIGGVFGGTLWQLSQWAYVELQVGVAKYNAIYGALAALPVFMVWLHLAWVIVLLGLVVTCTVQKFGELRSELGRGQISPLGRTRITLAVLVVLAQRFRRGVGAPDAATLAIELDIPPRILRQVLEQLQRLGLVVEVAGPGGVNAFQPAREPDCVRVAEVLALVAADGSDYLPPRACPVQGTIIATVEALSRRGAEGVGEVTVRDLVEEIERGGTAQLPAG